MFFRTLIIVDPREIKPYFLCSSLVSSSSPSSLETHGVARGMQSQNLSRNKHSQLRKKTLKGIKGKKEII